MDASARILTDTLPSAAGVAPWPGLQQKVTRTALGIALADAGTVKRAAALKPAGCRSAHSFFVSSPQLIA